eukprot:5791512-Karenia_brevis.AAC.1
MRSTCGTRLSECRDPAWWLPFSRLGVARRSGGLARAPLGHLWAKFPAAYGVALAAAIIVYT